MANRFLILAMMNVQQYWSALRINILALQSNNKGGWNVTGFLDRGIVESLIFDNFDKKTHCAIKTWQIVKKQAWRYHKILLCNMQATGMLLLRWSILHDGPYYTDLP